MLLDAIPEQAMHAAESFLEYMYCPTNFLAHSQTHSDEGLKIHIIQITIPFLESPMWPDPYTSGDLLYMELYQCFLQNGTNQIAMVMWGRKYRALLLNIAHLLK